MFRRTRVLSASVALLAAGCSSNSASPGGSGSNAPVTIKAVLPPNTGPITAADNAGLKQLTTQYESAHKNVTVQWLPNNTGSISAANAQVESQASGGAAPDVVWEQYGPVTSGALPPGLLQNIKPYLTKPNPYVPGNSSWLSQFTPETGAPTVNLPGLNNLVPTSTAPKVIDVVLDNVLSTVATNSGSRLFQEYVNGSLSYSAFASQWQSLLTSAAQQWATQNHVDLNKY
jgi:hypothetical protein